jgi:hypothetical protein
MSIMSRLRRGRNVPPVFLPDRATDRFLVSYPRSGNTWLRAILFHARLDRSPVNLTELDRAIPDQYVPPSRERLLCVAPQIVKSHDVYRRDVAYRHVAYVLRDPRDVIPSYFRYMTRGRGADADFADFVQQALGGGLWPSSWFEHVIAWTTLAPQSVPDLTVIRYEDLRRHRRSATDRLADVLGLPPDRLAALVVHYDLDRMRALERAGNRDLGSPDRNWFVGDGGAPGDRRAIVDRAIREHAPHYLPLMERFGYR